MNKYIIVTHIEIRIPSRGNRPRNEQKSCAISRNAIEFTFTVRKTRKFQLSLLQNEELLVCAALVNMTIGIYFTSKSLLASKSISGTGFAP